MSLLNDALRKNTGEANKTKTGHLDHGQSAPQKVNRGKLYRIGGLLFLLGSVVLGGWYFLGNLSAQIDSPVVANLISKRIDVATPSAVSVATEHHQNIAEPMSDMPAPKGDLTFSNEPAENITVEKTDTPAKNRPKNISSPSAKKAKKKPRQVKKNVTSKAPKVEDKEETSHQATLFLKKARRYHRQDKLNQAILMYQQVLKVRPDHQEALFNLASAYIQLAAYSEAFPLLEKLRSHDNDNPDVLINLAIVQIGMGKPAEALGLLDLAAKRYVHPKFEIYFHRAAALSRLGRLEEAMLSYKTAEDLNPKHPNLNFNLALLCDKLHQYHDAVNYYGSFLRHSDNLPTHEEKKIESRIRSLQAFLAQNSN